MSRDLPIGGGLYAASWPCAHLGHVLCPDIGCMGRLPDVKGRPRWERCGVGCLVALADQGADR